MFNASMCLFWGRQGGSRIFDNFSRRFKAPICPVAREWSRMLDLSLLGNARGFRWQSVKARFLPRAMANACSRLDKFDGI